MKWTPVLLAVLLSGLVGSVAASGTVTFTTNVLLRVSTGQVTVAGNMNMAWLVETPNNNTIQFNVAGYERSQGTYLFTVKSYGNGTLSLIFRGIPPVIVKGSSLSASYNYPSNLETVSYSASQTSPLQVIYAGVGPNIANAVTAGSGLLIALVLVIAFAFVLILIVRVKAVAANENNDDKGLARLITYLSALLGVALVFLVILALLAAFTPYFNGLGV